MLGFESLDSNFEDTIYKLHNKNREELIGNPFLKNMLTVWNKYKNVLSSQVLPLCPVTELETFQRIWKFWGVYKLFN